MSTIILQPFPSYDEGLTPPQFEYVSDQGFIEPDDEHIISMREGHVLSLYGDDIWDLSPYGTNPSAKLDFTSIVLLSLKKEAKRLAYLIMTHSVGKNRTLPSGSTVYRKHNEFVRPLAEYIQQLPIKEEERNFNYLLTHIKRFRDFIVPFARKSTHLSVQVLGVLTLLKENSKECTGFEYIPSKRTERALKVIKKRHKNTLSQTILIPASIYSSVGKMRWEHIDAIEPYTKNFAEFISDHAVCKGFGASNNSSLTIEERKGFVQWKDAVNRHGLSVFFEQYEVTGLISFFEFIVMIQGTCRHLIHQYTGMRSNECLSLNRECWKKKNDTMPSRIHGIEQKIHGIPTHQVWITHDAIKRVIDLLKTIGTPMTKRANPKLKNTPLMIKVSKIIKREVVANHYEALQISQNIKELPFKDLESITLTQEHIDEMSLVDDRDWGEHEWVEVGAVWQFATQQYRRALAVYALGSDLVSLHAIKEQFGHLLSAMTAYYGNGHGSAKKLDGSIDKNEHIAKYINGISKDIEFYSFRKNVLLSKVPLYGANGTFLEKHVVARTPEEREVVMQNSVNLKKEFKKKGMFYRETAIGGCTNLYCEKHLLPDFLLSIVCFGCEHSILRLDKAERLTEKMRLNAMKYAEIQPNSIDHQTMLEVYDEMNHFTDILRRKEQKEIAL